jgi:cell division protease FtsH
VKNNGRGWLLVLFLALVVLLGIIMSGQTEKAQPRELTMQQLVNQFDAGKVKDFKIKDQVITGTLEDGTPYRTIGPKDMSAFLSKLAEKNVWPENDQSQSAGVAGAMLLPVLAIVFVFILILLFMRQIQVGGGKAMSFGKSRARLLNESTRRMTFDDVAGCDEAKEELEEIIQFLKDPRKFTRLGGRIPKGVLLMGPPGTGKTLLARSVAGEAGVPFFSISGSDFVEMFVGVGASRVRDLFEQGKKHAPCIIFVDEIDAVGRHRGAGMGGGHDEREQTLNQLLVEMDGFESNEGVIMVAATNRPDVLDPALLRPGRFDRRIVVSNPDVKGRLGILHVHTRRVPVADDVQLEVIARATPGFSGADLENLVNEAALLAARFEKRKVEMSDFEASKDKVSMGAERRSMVIPEHERERTAIHEAGHAIVARLLPDSDNVHKVTIIPRGRALGVTHLVPDEDRLGMTHKEMRTRLAIFMGGRAAEEITMSEFSTGASDDLKKATRIARAMVTEYGMSEAVGPVVLSDDNAEVFLGRDWVQHTEFSEHTAQMVDSEIRSLLEEAYAVAKTTLLSNLHILNKLAQQLLERETVEGAELERIIVGLNPVYPQAKPA